MNDEWTSYCGISVKLNKCTKSWSWTRNSVWCCLKDSFESRAPSSTCTELIIKWCYTQKNILFIGFQIKLKLRSTLHGFLWTDKAVFTRKCIFDQSNSHVWADRNPHAVRQHNVQQEFQINVWLEKISDFSTDPHFLPNRLTPTHFSISSGMISTVTFTSEIKFMVSIRWWMVNSMLTMVDSFNMALSWFWRTMDWS